MEFWNEQSGIVVGDPVDGRFFIARTFDNGSTWQDIPLDKRPVADSGEGCFASSGTNVRALDKDEAVFVSGGKRSRIFIRNKVIDLPFVKGKETDRFCRIAVMGCVSALASHSWQSNLIKSQPGVGVVRVSSPAGSPHSMPKSTAYAARPEYLTCAQGCG